MMQAGEQSAKASKGQRRVFRALAAALICSVVPTAPGEAQFDFLFGPRQQAKPPPGPAAPKAEASPSKADVRKHHKVKLKDGAPAKSPASAKPPAAEAEPPLPPYDSELQRLAEILGALTYLGGLCTASPPVDWRARMQALLEAEAKTGVRKQRLAGSYNRGFHDYERTYHFCTPNAQVVIDRFLVEGSKISRDVVNRYGAT
jgi:uncharacterized protein (TIGR02301 family)